MVLRDIHSPADLKKIPVDQLAPIADQLRDYIIDTLSSHPGHLASSLGTVELTIALHYVFNSPVDKFIFDVSHQCYPHKILTGRKDGYTNPDNYFKYTGYTAPEETRHDLFKIGHTSTSVSLATGLAKGRDLLGGKENVVAIIGDGSLTGGEALEGLNNAATLNSNIIIIVNDNDMSIAENQGGICNLLTELRKNNGVVKDNFFKALGFEYHYIADGHNIENLIETFSKVKDTDHPVLIHMHTIKGKGFEPAVVNKEPFHWILPGTLDRLNDAPAPQKESYESITKDYILNKAEAGEPIIAMSAATPGVFGWNKEFRDKLGLHYIDVGIAEQHAVGMASGIAKRGGKPVLAFMSSFVQRTYDQLSQDMALNNAPVTMLIFWGGISNADATHLCTFDIPLISNIPNIVYLAPTCKEEYVRMLDWSVNQTEHPVAIRVPYEITYSGENDTTDYSILNKYKTEEKGEKVAIVALGDFLGKGRDVKALLKEKTGINATLINPRFITGIDKDMLEGLKSNHSVVITLENGELDGGFGEKITRFYGDSSVKVLNFGSDKEFTDRTSIDELYNRYHLTNELIVQDIQNIL